MEISLAYPKLSFNFPEDNCIIVLIGPLAVLVDSTRQPRDTFGSRGYNVLYVSKRKLRLISLEVTL